MRLPATAKIYNKERLVCTVQINEGEVWELKSVSGDKELRPTRLFGVSRDKMPSSKQFAHFITDRVAPPYRQNIEEILEELHLDHYDQLDIVEKIDGRSIVDDLSIKFEHT